ncbi:MAG: N-6 DNA methylase [Acidobacteriia bacterium]|nr:N-6 DNA methylase [Terriglobia bacterium]
MSIPEFVAQWQRSTLSERSAAQQHFIGLCEILGQPTPATVDQEGNTYTFEKGVTKTSGGNGFADVWMRNFFAWEYKGRHKDLHAAYQQLLQYREDLENPPLLVVCDLDRFEVHTNYTNTQKQIYAFDLADLVSNQPTATCKLPPLDVLRAAFTDPGRLKPGQTTADVTEGAAAQFSKLAESLRSRGVPSERAAHFLMRLLFCLFSEDIGLLPGKLFSHLVESNLQRPAEFTKRLRQLFGAMAGEQGSFGEHDIPYFDGGLFSDDEAYDLTRDDLAVLALSSVLDWSSIEPAIFGTLFERSLDPDKRSQLGAHYTSEADIRLIVEPVLMEPLRRRWAEVEQKATALIEKSKTQQKAGQTKSRKALSDLLMGFAEELSKVRVLDPACGSGNFLYVALKQILDLEKKVSVFAASNGLSGLLPRTSPEQLYGIETNVYAHELASVVVWIGYIQWQHDNGFHFGSHPILKPLKNIKRMDAVLAYDDKGQPLEPAWPDADVIIGNPPFLGGNKVRHEMGDKYIDDLFHVYEGRVPAFADFVCYWFEKAREYLEQHPTTRVGLLATNSIRGGANRKVLESIQETGNIFWAQSDRDWVLDGANVRVSMVAFDRGHQETLALDGQPVTRINPDLSGAVNITTAKELAENQGICFMGPSAKGPFDITHEVAERMLDAPVNVNGRPNSDVVRPVKSGIDLVQENRNYWTIDFGLTDQKSAAKYEMPFEYARQHVYPIRSKNRRRAYAERWWIYAEPRPGLRKALTGLSRFIATPALSKHRILVWVSPDVLCNQGTLVFARDDDYFFGVLHSHVHDLWALKQGTSLEDRPRYTPTSTFETFPFPWSPGKEPKYDPRVEAIAAAARELVKKRDTWLNPPDASAAELKKRTLTNLYNENPTWLQDAHRELDDAALAAYGWPKNLSDQDILTRLLQFNMERSRPPI